MSTRVVYVHTTVTHSLPSTMSGAIHSHSGLQGMSVESSSSGPHVRRRDEKQCAVCGDHAVGFNFGAIACESCKAFFRRNALRMPPCLFNANCLIQVKTRRFCSPCRLAKCFAVGMRKSCIMGAFLTLTPCYVCPACTQAHESVCSFVYLTIIGSLGILTCLWFHSQRLIHFEPFLCVSARSDLKKKAIFVVTVPAPSTHSVGIGTRHVISALPTAISHACAFLQVSDDSNQ
ncbi:unnamed protein product [Mesocestoides corti]|uniref:Nuclear receptor domain-containing protein n=1 Tax=Mesocestoides corti TaxID=53468 RepID=A0A3P6GNA2_MESCO|nr:unnamed protein product [Mesocestoides corti]